MNPQDLETFIFHLSGYWSQNRYDASAAVRPFKSSLRTFYFLGITVLENKGV